MWLLRCMSHWGSGCGVHTEGLNLPPALPCLPRSEAQDALYIYHNSSLLDKGIELAKHLNKAIVT